LVVLSDNSDVINSPIPYADVPKDRVVALLHASNETTTVDATATRHKFMERHEDFMKN
jgi:hypothetical protein